MLYNRSKHTELLLVTANKQHGKKLPNTDLNVDKDLNFFK